MPAPQSYNDFISGIFRQTGGGRIHGLDRLRRKIKQLPIEARAAMKVALQTSAEELVAMQRRLVPVSSGKLQRSIDWTTNPSQVPAYAAFQGGGGAKAKAENGLVAIVYAGNTEVRYAHLVEFGAAPHTAGGMFEGAEHPGAPAQPFFFVSYRALRKRAQRRIAAASRQAAKKVAGTGK
jgi:hypothetical protein